MIHTIDSIAPPVTAAEVPAHIMLYRGDSDYINRYQMAKVRNDALFGPGIYFTDDPAVAATYRYKSNSGGMFLSRAWEKRRNQSVLIFQGAAASAEFAKLRALRNISTPY